MNPASEPGRVQEVHQTGQLDGLQRLPTEVKKVLYRHPRLARAAVIGVPEDRTGEAVKAGVAPCAGG
ncbi:MAG: hypothetical protein ACE1Z0_02495 [Acidimicrobiia bacterium]